MNYSQRNKKSNASTFTNMQDSKMIHSNFGLDIITKFYIYIFLLIYLLYKNYQL